MKRAILTASVVAALLPFTALEAQVMPNPGAPASHGASLLKVTATKPYLLGPAERIGLAHNAQGRFRLLFRVVASAADELPIMLVGYGGPRADYLFHWTAYSSGGARCSALKEDVTGIRVFDKSVDPEYAVGLIQRLEDTDTHASGERPTIVSADFNCDSPIHPGDTVTVQVKFFVRSDYRWTEADYTFENLALGAH